MRAPSTVQIVLCLGNASPGNVCLSASISLLLITVFFLSSVGTPWFRCRVFRRSRFWCPERVTNCHLMTRPKKKEDQKYSSKSENDSEKRAHRRRATGCPAGSSGNRGPCRHKTKCRRSRYKQPLPIGSATTRPLHKFFM